MGQYYVGLDVHSRQSAFVIEDTEGRVITQGEIPTTRTAVEGLRAAHQLPLGRPRPLETGTVTFFVARQLAAVGLAPVIGQRARGPPQGQYRLLPQRARRSVSRRQMPTRLS